MKTFVITATTTSTRIETLLATAGYTYNSTDWVERKKCYIYCTTTDIQIEGGNGTGTSFVPILANQWLVLDDNTTNIGSDKLKVATGTASVNIILY